MPEESDANEVKANFAYDLNMSDNSLTLWQYGKSITLSYWDCLLLNHILDKNINC
jgi:hypothetical protein